MKRLLCALLVLAPAFAFGQAGLALDNTKGFKILSPTNFLNTNFISTKQVKVNHFSGQDDIARSYTTKAWSNIWAAASNSVAGDVILADAGDYPMVDVANTIKLPNDVSLFGSPGQTFVTWTNNNANVALINPGNNSVIFGVHFRAYTTFGSGGILKIITTENNIGTKAWSNAVFRSCVFEGQTDAYAPSSATPVNTKFWDSLFTGHWDLLVTGGSPSYSEYNNSVFYINGQGRDALDPEQVTIDWSATVLKTSSGCTNIFNNCWLVVTNTGIPTVLDLESGHYFVRDTGGTGYHTNWTVFNNCIFAAAGTNSAFGGSWFGGKETNAWVNSNNVIRFYGGTRQQYYPPVGAYGMFEANTICGNWGDHNVYMPNAATRIYRLPNAGPNGKPFFDGEEVTIIDFGKTAKGTNITITTRGGQTIDGLSSATLYLDGQRRTLRVDGTNWVTVDSFPPVEVSELRAGKVVITNGFPSASIAGWGGSNVQWRLVKTGVLTNVTDCSAAAYYPSNNTFFTTHNNNNGRVTEWTLDGTFVRKIDWTASQIGDAESVTYMGGNKFGIVDENENRIIIFTVTNGAGNVTISTNGLQIIQLASSIAVDGVGGGGGVEGMCYDFDRDGWWVIKEKVPSQILFVSKDGSVTNNWFSTAQMIAITNANSYDFSDVFLDRNNQVLWVTQDEGAAGQNQYDRAVGISLVTSNVLFTVACTNFGQLEGISLTTDGNLLVVGEVNQFAIFEPVFGGLNSGVSWVNVPNGNTNGPGLPFYPNGAFFGDGTANLPSVGWFSDADGSGTGWYRPAANQASFSAGGSAVATLYASGVFIGPNELQFGLTIASTPDITVRRQTTNNTSITNYVGLNHVSAAAVLSFNANNGSEWIQTNRPSGAQSIILSNASDGFNFSGIILGEVAGGSSRVMTFIPNTGQLIHLESEYSTGLATSLAITATNGLSFRWWSDVRRVNGTNIHHFRRTYFKH